MKLKSVISWVALWTTLLTQSCTEDKKESIQHNIYDTITNISLSQKEIINPLEETKENLPSYFNTQPFVDTLTIDMDRVRTGPLGTMPKLAKNFAALLWYHGYNKEILIKYNPELDSLLQSKNLEQISYHDIKQKTIKTPAIYPDLKDFAKLNLKDFLQDKPQWVQDSLRHDHEAIIITRNKENQVVTLYYNHGQIEFAQYSSPGTWKIVREYDHRLKKKRRVDTHTPEGLLYTNYNKDLKRYTYKIDSLGNKIDSTEYNDPDDLPRPYRVSGSFGNAPMPYAVPILNTSKHNGIFFHQGRSNGNKLSHGCARQTGQIAMELFDRVDERKVKVAIFNLYDKKKEDK